MLVNELHQGGIRALMGYDSTLFDNIQLPEGLDLTETVDHILYKYGDAPLFSPNPDVVKFYIGRWSKRRLPLWKRYKAAIELEYNPLENYDRQEYTTFTHGKKTTHSGTVTDATSGKITDQPSGTIVNTPSGTITDSQDSTDERLRAADNSSNYEGYDKDTHTGKTNERTYTNYKEEVSYNQYKEERSFDQYQQERTYDNSDEDSGDDVTDGRIHGNIGVTTSQMMLTSEVNLIRDNLLDLMDYIADDWHSEFNLMIYV